MRVEEQIRDFLADNLDFISPQLTLIQKEYYLPAKIGSKGYVDILAKDNFNNFVIIEIKRSEQAARQAISELLKYQGLIKQKYKAKQSEIKLVIISTSWNELIRPFSEIFESVFISGFKIDLDSRNIPKSISPVEPETGTIHERKISPMQTVELFYTESKREAFIKIAKTKLLEIGIRDFVFVLLNSTGLDQRIVFPYALYFSFQRQPMYRNYEILSNLDEEIKDIDFNGIDHRLMYIDELIYINLDLYEHHDSMEASDPVKFASIINSDHWNIVDMVKNGIFFNDPRISDELILNEIKGYDGENETKFLDYTDSSNFKKLERIRKNLGKALLGNVKLKKHIDHIFELIIAEGRSFKIVVEIFYPRSIFDSIWRCYSTSDPNYLPSYNIVVIFEDSTQIYHFRGELHWNGKSVNVQKLLEKVTEYEPFFTFFQCFNGSLDGELLKIMNLEFVNLLYKMSSGEIESSEQIKLRSNRFVADKFNYTDFESFYNSNKELMNEITQLYKTYIIQ